MVETVTSLGQKVYSLQPAVYRQSAFNTVQK